MLNVKWHRAMETGSHHMHMHGKQTLSIGKVLTLLTLALLPLTVPIGVSPSLFPDARIGKEGRT